MKLVLILVLLIVWIVVLPAIAIATSVALVWWEDRLREQNKGRKR